MPKLRQLAFSGEIISEDITAQVHWLMKGDGRKRGQIKLDAKSKSRQAYTRWYAYCGEDDIWEDDWTNPTYKVEEICEISVADHGGNELKKITLVYWYKSATKQKDSATILPWSVNMILTP